MAVDRERGASWSAKLGLELLFLHFLFLTYTERWEAGFYFLACTWEGTPSLEGESKASKE